MALRSPLPALLFALALSSFQLSTCQVLEGKVSCSDCNDNSDFSGIKVLVKCKQVKKLAVATTEVSGSFKVELPSDTEKSTPNPLKCHAKLLGGPLQLYVSKKNKVSKVVKSKDSNSFTINSPFAFSTTCPATLKESKCKTANEFDSSKTVDLPLPREWGLAPSSYYIPFFPIIGVP